MDALVETSILIACNIIIEILNEEGGEVRVIEKTFGITKSACWRVLHHTVPDFED